METPLEQATRHVTEGRRVIARQKLLIARLQAAGCRTAVADGLLVQFEQTQRIFEDDLARLEKARKS